MASSFSPASCTFMGGAWLCAILSVYTPAARSNELELFDARRDLIVGAETDFAQKETSATRGYDLADHNQDILQYRREWFDLACQYRPGEGDKWLHIVDKAGGLVDDAAMGAMCDNTTPLTATEAAERYLLIGYTPEAADARDGTGMRKNFAVLLRGTIRQDLLNDTQKNGEANFVIDGYLFDHRLAQPVFTGAKTQDFAGLKKLCARLERFGQNHISATMSPPEVARMLQEGGLDAENFEESPQARTQTPAGEQLMAQLKFICGMRGGPAATFNAGYERVDGQLAGTADGRDGGAYQVASFGRNLWGGGLRSVSRAPRSRVKPCRYLVLTPDMTPDGSALIAGEHGEVAAAMAGKVCFAAYLQVERSGRPETIPDCAPPFTMGCVPDHSATMLVEPHADVSLGLFDRYGMTAVKILEGRPRGDDLLELVKFNMTASVSSVYTKISAIRRLVVASVDYDVSLDALRGKLGIHLGSSLAAAADGLYAAMVNMLKNWDKAAQISTTLSDFTMNYFDTGRSFDLVKFPERIAVGRAVRLNPAVFYFDDPGHLRTMLGKDGCACFKAADGLIDARSPLLRLRACGGARLSDGEWAAYKAQTLALFSGIEETCLNYLGGDECAARKAYMEKMNLILAQSPAPGTCEEAGAPGGAAL